MYPHAANKVWTLGYKSYCNTGCKLKDMADVPETKPRFWSNSRSLPTAWDQIRGNQSPDETISRKDAIYRMAAASAVERRTEAETQKADLHFSKLGAEDAAGGHMGVGQGKGGFV